MKKLTLVALILFISSVSSASIFERVTVTYEVKNEKKPSKETIIVFLKRVNELKTGFFSSVDIEEGDDLIVHFKGFVPDDQELNYFSSNRGYLVAKLVGSNNIIFDSSDISNATASFAGDKSFIDVQLSPYAGEKLKRVTTASLGKRILITLDGKVILNTKLEEPIGRYFGISAESVELASKQALLLRHGHLKEGLFLRKVN